MARPQRILDNRGRPIFEALGLRRVFWRDAYHRVLDSTWRAFFALALATYLVLHAIFAVLYLAVPGSITNTDGSFGEAYFFSVQTMMTIGYGGMMPANLFGDVMVTIEAFVGLVCTAVMTGLVFAKFSKPSANVLFSKVAVINLHEGLPTLMFRMANARGNRIVEASLTLIVARSVITKEGESFRRIEDLKLTRTRTPLFGVSWTAMHVIDDESPLAHCGYEELLLQNAEMTAVLSGVDETSSQGVHARYVYGADEILWDMRFEDILLLEGERRVLDYRRFHDVKTAKERVPRNEGPLSRERSSQKPRSVAKASGES